MNGVQRAYVGSRTTRERHARGAGISQFRVEADGALVLEAVHGGLVNPSYLALNRAGTRLYCVHGDGDAVSSFRVDVASGGLSLLGTRTFDGLNPVHLALDPLERHLLVSDHLGTGRRGGSLLVFAVSPDGSLGEPTQQIALQGEPGPHRVEQTCAKPHFNPFDPAGRHVLVPDKGLDRVFVFTWSDGRIDPAPRHVWKSRAGAGPRGIAFGRDGRTAYVVNELDNTVCACRFDAVTGTLAAFQLLSVLPEDFTGDARAAGIEVSADGRWLHVSSRGSDLLTRFDIAADGRLRFASAQASGGRTPRFFCLSPAGASLYALNEDSDNIVQFRVAADGTLSETRTTACGSPVCMVFSPGG